MILQDNAHSMSRRTRSCNACGAGFVPDLEVCDWGIVPHHRSCRECILAILETTPSVKKRNTRFRCPRCDLKHLSCNALHVCKDDKERRLLVKMLLDRNGLIVTCREVKEKQEKEGPGTLPSGNDHKGKRKVMEINTDGSDGESREDSDFS